MKVNKTYLQILVVSWNLYHIFWNVKVWKSLVISNDPVENEIIESCSRIAIKTKAWKTNQ